MTATSYVALDNDDLGANKIFRAATASALDTNPVAIAQRGTGAPWLNGIGAIETITSGSGNWTVPAGVYRIKVTAVGGGGGGRFGASNGVDGGDTTFGTITGGGGQGGFTSASPAPGGTASGGDINLQGQGGGVGFGGDSSHGHGGHQAIGGGAGWAFSPTGYGGGSSGDGTGVGGGGGGTAIKVFSVEPGDLMAYSVGTGATDGIIIIEY